MMSLSLICVFRFNFHFRRIFARDISMHRFWWKSPRSYASCEAKCFSWVQPVFRLLLCVITLQALVPGVRACLFWWMLVLFCLHSFLQPCWPEAIVSFSLWTRKELLQGWALKSEHEAVNVSHSTVQWPWQMKELRPWDSVGLHQGFLAGSGQLLSRTYISGLLVQGSFSVPLTFI